MKDYINKLFLGDAEKKLKEIPDESIDASVTSPPYDKLRTYTGSIDTWNIEKFKNIADQLYRVTKKGGIVAWVVGDATIKGSKTLSSFKQAIYFQEIGFDMFDVLIYEKSGSGPPHKNRYFNVFEYIFILSKGRPKTINLLKDKLNKWGGYKTYAEITRREADGTLTKKEQKTIGKYGIRTNIWKYNNGKGQTTRDKVAHNHPAIFPEKLVEDILKSWTSEGDIILDPFGGSGTTAKISYIMDRKYIYIEQVEEYYRLASKRIDDIRGIFND